MTKWADKVEERLEIVGRGKRRRPEDYPARTRMEDDRTRQSVNRASRRRVIVHFSDDAGAAAAAIVTHEADSTAHPASSIVNTPAGGVAATTVQGAINELDSEKAAASHSHAATDITSGTLSPDRYSAYTDLTAESKIGTGSGQLAHGDHAHSGVYEPAFGTAAWTISNDITDRTFDPSSTTLQEIGNALATLIRDFAAANKPSV